MVAVIKDLRNYLHQNRHSWKFKQDPEVVPEGTSWIMSVYYWWQYHVTLWEIRMIRKHMEEMKRS